jgi:hypothetical protein
MLKISCSRESSDVIPTPPVAAVAAGSSPRLRNVPAPLPNHAFELLYTFGAVILGGLAKYRVPRRIGFQVLALFCHTP